MAEKNLFGAEVTAHAIDTDRRQADFLALLGGASEAGAIASFIGVVRATGQTGSEIDSMTLEHYPGMTQKQLELFVSEARQNWHLQGMSVAHRYGCLQPGEVIVHVIVAAAHRKEAFAACENMVERLKHEAPFWKKESGGDGDHWVAAQQKDG